MRKNPPETLGFKQKDSVRKGGYMKSITRSVIIGFGRIRLGIATFLFLMGIQTANAQWRLEGPFNKFSLEMQTGIDFPLSPDPKSQSLANFITAPSFKVGVRYMFSDLLGIRPVYRYNAFRSGNSTSLGIHQYGVDGILNLAEFLPAGNYREPRKINVLLHLGGSHGREVADDGSGTPERSRIAVGSAGITPQYRLSRNVVLVLDLSGHASVKQSFGYDGSRGSIDASGWMPNAYYMTGSVGLQVYLGKYADHMDWK